MTFTTDIDIANRALQHCGVPRIVAFTDSSRQAAETGFCYDMLRVAELRRSTWRFATRRAMLRPLTTTSLRVLAPVYDAAVSYAAGRLAQTSDGTYWLCMVANTGQTPGTMTRGLPAYWAQYFGPLVADTWSASVSYSAGELVFKSGPVFYLSLTNANLNHDPASGAPWVALTSTTSSAIIVPEPAGVGMLVGAVPRNVYPLPNGYLRVLGPDPRAASTSRLETSGALRFSDWQFEGNYIVSAGNAAILLRFVADVSHVPDMDALFCEGLGARVAYEVCEILTQSNTKLQAIGAAYQKFVKDARLINWIESGSTEPMEEEYELTKGPQGVLEGSAPANGQAQ